MKHVAAKLGISLSLSALLLSGCAVNQPKPDAGADFTSDLPEWVLNPTVEGGLAAADCVASSGDFSLDKAEVTAQARAALVKQLNVSVQAMDKTYKRKVQSADGTSAGGTFETVSKQVANEFLRGSRVIKLDYVGSGSSKNLCALVALNPQATKALFDEILSQSQENVSPQSEAELYEEFRAAKAQQELSDAVAQ